MSYSHEKHTHSNIFTFIFKIAVVYRFYQVGYILGSSSSGYIRLSNFDFDENALVSNDMSHGVCIESFALSLTVPLQKMDANFKFKF